MKRARTLLAGVLLSAMVATGASAQIVNGGFEASTSQTATPTGWTNIGHSDGVIAYTVFGTPAYQGNYFYDLGGYGDSTGPVGDGIMQTVATTIGANYVLTFGLTSENNSTLISQLTVTIGGQATVFNLGGDSTGQFKKPFATQTINYLATGTSTMISFIETANASGGNNDPLIDGVSFLRAGVTAVPEPATWGLMILGMGAVGIAMRRRVRRSEIRFDEEVRRISERAAG